MEKLIQQMKHLHFVQSLETKYGGGLGKSALDLNSTLNAIGIRSELISVYNEEKIANIPFVNEFKSSFPQSFFFSRDLENVVTDYVSRTSFIHRHGFYFYTSYLAGKYAIKYNKPLISHVHGIFDPWIMGKGKLKKKIIGYFFENRYKNKTGLWRALTLKEADQIRSLGITGPIIVEPNGIHLDEWNNDITNDDKAKNILFLGRIHPKKGLDILVKSWSKIENKLKKDWIINIIGPDENNHKKDIVSLINDLKQEKYFVFHNAVNGKEKIKFFKNCSFYILPSYSEGLPLTVLEAMAAQKPVIITDECNLPEVKEYEAGWIVKPKIDELSSVLKTVLSVEDKELYEKGVNGYKLVEKKFSWPKIADNIHQACMELI